MDWLNTAVGAARWVSRNVVNPAVCSVDRAVGKKAPEIAPKEILKELNNNKTIPQIEAGDKTFKADECYSKNGKEALILIQKALYSLGYLQSSVQCNERIERDFDGIFGPTTKSAVMDFQRKEMGKTNPSGVIDKDTMIALKAALGR